MKKIILILFLVALELYPQNWSMKILDIDTAHFPLMPLAFTAYNGRSRLIENITLNDVKLLEGKKPVILKNLELTKSPLKLSVAVLLDVSGSMKGEKIKKAVEAASNFLNVLSPSDEAVVVPFGSEYTIEKFTNDYEYLKKQMQNLKLSTNTRLYDGLYETAKLFSTVSGKRNAIILITDGKDEGSYNELNTAILEAVKNKIEVFSLGIGDNKAGQVLGKISFATGASYFSNIKPGELNELLSNIYTYLTRVYMLDFVTADSIVEAAYEKRYYNFFLTCNSVTKNEQMELNVPHHGEPLTSDINYGTFMGAALFLIAVGFIVWFYLSKNKKVDAGFYVATPVSDLNKTPHFDENGNSGYPSGGFTGDGGETEAWEERLRKDIKEEKTVIISKGKFKTDESLGYLVLRSKKFGMYVYEIKQKELIIGRGAQADIFLDDETISRMQTKIRIIEKVFYVDDLGSSNGTFINGEIVYHSELKDGDVIGIGEHEFIFKCV